jgi:hypothetical protein
MKEVIGYYIAENTSGFNKPEIKEKSKNYIKIETILQDFDLNRNGRLYEQSLFSTALEDENIKEMKARKSWFGEAGHPFSTEIQRLANIEQTRISHIILSTSIENNSVIGVVESANTFVGKNDFKGLVEQGSKVAFSMRGFAKSLKKENKEIVQAPLKIITYDWVVFPSHKSAVMKRTLNESSSLIYSNDTIVELRESEVIDLVKNESENFNFFLEFLNKESKENYESVKLNKNASIIEIQLENGKQFIKLEEYAKMVLLKNL